MVYLYENDIPKGLSLGDVVAIDTETLGLNILRDRLCLVQMCSGDGNAHIVKFDGAHYDKAHNLIKMLSNPKITKLFHFARFDLAILNYTFELSIENIYCTKIASKIARTYTDKHGLKNLCKELLGVELSKQEQSSYWGAKELTQEQINYAANDVLHLHAIKKILDEMLIQENRMSMAMCCFQMLQDVIVPLDLAQMNPEFIFSH